MERVPDIREIVEKGEWEQLIEFLRNERGHLLGLHPIGKRVVIQLMDLMNDEDLLVRERAAEALGIITKENPELVELFVKELTTSVVREWNIAESVIEVIAKGNSELLKPVVSKLIRILNEGQDSLKALSMVPPNYIRWKVTLALGVIGKTNPELAEQVVPELINLLDDEDLFVRGSALISLQEVAEVNPDLVRPTIPKLMKKIDDDEKVRSSIVYLFATIAKGDPKLAELIVPKLINMLDNKLGRDIITFAFEGIARVNPKIVEPAIPKLISLLDDGDPRIRAKVAHALRMIAKENPELVKPAVPKLIKLLDDKDEKVRVNAALALKYVGPEEALVPLKKLLNDISKVLIETTVGEVAEDTIRKIEAREMGSQSPTGRC
ncbi:MAG: sister chromatid cohesion protein PDS5 [Candidatus Heimdallarchaeaceae archaeon]